MCITVTWQGYRFSSPTSDCQGPLLLTLINSLAPVKFEWNFSYRQVSNISGTLVGNKIVDHSDVVGASPVGAAPTTPSFST